MEGFAKEITSLSNLRKLSLSFEECPSLTNKGLSTFFKLLPKLSGLTSLELNIGKNDKIDWKGGLATLYENLSQLKLLEEFKLEVAESKQFNDLGFINLIDCLEGHQGLNTLYLDFSGCHSISDKGVSALSTNLEELKSVEYLTIKLDGCVGVT